MQYARRTAAVTTALAVVVTGLAVAAGPAAAAPGSPGVPSDPVTVFHEDFENAPDAGYRTMLDAYAAPDGSRYSANPYWVDNVAANGMVASFGNTSWYPADGTGAQNGTEAVARGTVRQLAEAIGRVNGSSDPQGNSAVSAYTQSTGAAAPGNKVMLQSGYTMPPAGTANGRFYIASMTAAAANCRDAAHPSRQDPQYALSIVEQGTGAETRLTTAPINACATAPVIPMASLANGTGEAVHAGRFASDKAFTYSGKPFAVVLRNLTSAHLGDDGSFDDIAVLDATPQLDKAFDRPAARVGETVRLTFTVTNTSELAAKDGWSFTDALPTGMAIAPSPNASVVGGTATVAAPAGATSVSVTGGLPSGAASMTVSLDVVATTAQAYTNGPANVSVAGLDIPADAELVVTDAPRAALLVRHVDEAGNELTTPTTSAGAPGDGYATQAASIPGYRLIRVDGDENGAYGTDGSTTTVTYVYAEDVAPADPIGAAPEPTPEQTPEPTPDQTPDPTTPPAQIPSPTTPGPSSTDDALSPLSPPPLTRTVPTGPGEKALPKVTVAG